MKENRKIIITSLIFISYLVIGTYIHTFIMNIDFFDNKYSDTILANIFFRFIVYYLYFILFGVAIGVADLIEEIKKSGKWTIKWWKIIIQGLPMVYIAFQYFLYFNPIKIIRVISIPFFIQNEYVSLLAMIAVGYIFITSIKRNPNIETQSEGEDTI